MTQLSSLKMLIVLMLCGCFVRCKQTKQHDNYLLVFTDSVSSESGYKNQDGAIVIPAGKYSYCFTDTFKTYAIVLNKEIGFVAIDLQENVLYKIFTYDNGPDYTMDGYFRIIDNSKIGFADSATGKIVIKPQFECAFPFENGIAKVSNNCSLESNEEHSTWVSSQWNYIDKKGRTVDKPNTLKN